MMGMRIDTLIMTLMITNSLIHLKISSCRCSKLMDPIAKFTRLWLKIINNILNDLYLIFKL